MKTVYTSAYGARPVLIILRSVVLGCCFVFTIRRISQSYNLSASI